MELGEAVARAGIRKTLLPRNPRRRAAAQQGGVPLLEEARRRLHVPRARGDRRGGAEEIPQARAARAQFRGARIRPLARHPPRDQPDRRSRIGTASGSASLREWCLEQPEIINISVNTPYPGTESWLTEERRLQTRDYRLFDIQHAVLPTRLPLAEFYEELVDDAARDLRQAPRLARASRDVVGISTRLLLRGQTNFVKSLFKLNSVYRPELLLADHAQAGRIRDPAAAARRRTRAPAPRRPRRSMSMRRAAAPAGRSTPRPKPLSTRRAWAPRRNPVLLIVSSACAHNAAAFRGS